MESSPTWNAASLVQTTTTACKLAVVQLIRASEKFKTGRLKTHPRFGALRSPHPGDTCHLSSDVHPHLRVAMIRTVQLVAFLLLFVVVSLAQDLLWSDEFDNSIGEEVVDKDVWTFDLGDWGWGNGEFQNYTTENAYVRDGLLHIECRRDGDSFTSARLKTEDGLYVRYGTIQARMRLPNVANGLWPAFWTLGKDFREISWPFAGEIDIMEVGQADAIVDGVVNRRVAAGVHFSDDSDMGNHRHDAGSIDTAFRFDQDFHVYQLDWTPDYARFSIDGQLIYEADISGSCGGTCTELHTPHFLLLNLAVGGGYTYVEGEPWGPERITADFPAVLQVDYVRVYQNGFAQLSGPASTVAVPASAPLPTTQSPVHPSPTPAPVNPSPTPAPTTPVISNEGALCSSHAGCGSLQGECCPTPEGLFLSCCENSPNSSARINSNNVRELCSANAQCSSLGLQGACCPTPDGAMFLDCCDSIPTACGNNGEECIVYSAMEFARQQSSVAYRNNGRTWIGLASSVFVLGAAGCLW